MMSVFLYLRDHPLIGMISSVLAGLLGLSAQKHPTDVGLIDEMTPILSFFALGIGVAVGVLTVILKFLQIIKARRELKEKKKK